MTTRLQLWSRRILGFYITLILGGTVIFSAIERGQIRPWIFFVLIYLVPPAGILALFCTRASVPRRILLALLVVVTLGFLVYPIIPIFMFR